MSSAIEVLKEFKNTIDWMSFTPILKLECEGNQCYASYPPKHVKELYDALSEALLALEKQEELKEWLEKEIQYFEMRIGDKDFPNALGFRNKLREIKERVGEQK